MATAKNTPLQLSMLLIILFMAPAIGAAVGYLSPNETREQARHLLNKILKNSNAQAQRDSLATKQGDFLTIRNASGEIVCSDGNQHEIPCWRMQMERRLLKDAPDAYSPSAPEQLLGIIKERTGPNGTIMTLTKKNDLLDPDPPSRKHSGSRLSSAQKALSN